MSITMGRAFFRAAWLINLAYITGFRSILGPVVSQIQDLIQPVYPFIFLDGKKPCPRPTLIVSLYLSIITLNVLCVLFQMFLLNNISPLVLKSLIYHL